MSETAEIIEQIPDAMLDDAAEVVTVLRNNPRVLAAVAVVAAGLGGFAGYKFAQKRLRMYYEDLSNQEIEQAREYYSSFRIKKTPEELAAEIADDPSDLGKDATEAFLKYAGETPVNSESELMSPDEKALYNKHGVPEVVGEVEGPTRTAEALQPIRQNAFEGRRSTPSEFNFEAEELNRTGERPYVITHDEFYQNERDWEQTHLVYYNGDDVLADERDQPIPDEDGTVGNENLVRFGHGSRDENIVYVRNENLEVEFEITRSWGKYSEEVLGLDGDDSEDGLKHSSAHGGVRRFRNHRDD